MAEDITLYEKEIDGYDVCITSVMYDDGEVDKYLASLIVKRNGTIVDVFEIDVLPSVINDDIVRKMLMQLDWV